MRRVVVAVVLGLVVGCSDTDSNENLTTGSAQVSVPLTVSDITRVSCTVSASDMATMTVDLTLANGEAKAIIAQIPAGTARLFTLNAYKNTTVVCAGTATSDITKDQKALVNVVLQCTPDTQNLGQAQIDGKFNFPPRIDSAVASTDTVATGGAISLTVSATDPDAGDTLTYAWTATAGTFSNTTVASTVWTAPNAAGTPTITITVSDNRSGSSKLDLPVTVTAAPPSCNYALSFTGTSGDRVTIPTATVLNPGTSSWTIEYWVYVQASTGQDQGLVGKFTSGENNTYHTAIQGTTGKIWFHLGDGGTETSNCSTTSSIVGDTTWHHVAAVRNRTDNTIQIYLDGVVACSATDSESSVDPSTALVLGNNPSGSTETPLHGKLDEVRIWSVARYSTTFTPVRCETISDKTDLAGEWRFEEGSGTIAADTSGHGNNGSLSGSTTWVATP